MMKWPGVFPGTLVFLCFCATCGLVYAGASHDAAMAIVHQGEAISGTGNLDAAMAEYARVEELYPEEYEAIAWARYRTSECLVAGWRWPEALTTMRWVWDRIEDGTITNPDARFWGAYQFARCVDRVGDKWFLAHVARKALDVYETFPEPSAGMEEAAGWLNYWRARHFIGKEQYVWGREAAETAWEIAKKVKNGTLAAWARLAMADALRGEGNLLLARQMLDECGDNYAPHEDDTYRLYLQTSQAEAKLGLGLAEDTRQSVMNVLEQEIGEPALRIRAALVYADDAIARGATMEVLGPLAVIRSSLRHVPLWGDQANDRWDRLRGRFPPELFASMLAELDASGSGSNLERAAIKLQLADRLASMGRGEEGFPVVEEAEALISGDDRYHVAISLLKARCGPEPTRPAVRRAIEKLIRQNRDNADLDQFLFEMLFPGFWERYGDSYMGPWLDWIEPALPPNLYRIAKGRWLRQHKKDHEGALALAEEVVAGTDGWNRFQARIDKIVALYRMGRDEEAEAALDDFLRETPDQGKRDFGLYFSGAWLAEYDMERAIGLFDRLIASPDRGVWWLEAMSYKGDLLFRAQRNEEAKSVLEELSAYPPNPGDGGVSVGQGLAVLALLHDIRLNDLETAKTYYEMVLEATESMRFAQSYTYEKYVETLRRNKKYQEMIEVCDRGLRQLPYTEEVHRCLLRLWKCDGRFRLGEKSEAVSTAESMLEERIPQKAEKKIKAWLSWARAELGK